MDLVSAIRLFQDVVMVKTVTGVITGFAAYTMTKLPRLHGWR